METENKWPSFNVSPPPLCTEPVVLLFMKTAQAELSRMKRSWQIVLKPQFYFIRDSAHQRESDTTELLICNL